MKGVREYLDAQNATFGGRVQWSYQREVVGTTSGDHKHHRVLYNCLHVTWAPMAVGATTMEPPKSLADELAKLNDLKDKGILNDADFEAAKAKVLG